MEKKGFKKRKQLCCWNIWLWMLNYLSISSLLGLLIRLKKKKQIIKKKKYWQNNFSLKRISQKQTYKNKSLTFWNSVWCAFVPFNPVLCRQNRFYVLRQQNLLNWKLVEPRSSKASTKSMSGARPCFGVCTLCFGTLPMARPQCFSW